MRSLEKRLSRVRQIGGDLSGFIPVVLPECALTFDSVGKNRLLCLFIARDVVP
jgi:hypothetical protein